MVQSKIPDRLALPAVAVGVVAVAAAAIFVRLADAPAIAVAFWRCALGVVVLLPLAVVRRERIPRGKTLRVGLLAGVALGAHFGFWISSLDYTSVAASVVLVTTQPVFVAGLAYILFGEKTSLVSFAGILIAIAGTVLIAQDDSLGSAAFLGNALALIGAVMVAIYFLIGRSLRTGGMGVLPYAIVVYSSASFTLFITALVSGTPLLGYSGETWLWLWCLTLGPQIMGHTVFNWALRYLEASIVAGTILAEPVIAAFLAWLVLSEKPGGVTVVGGAIILTGLSVLFWGRR
ncbi:MAG: DMT family transporter [Rubrobacteraceae bacterium]